MHTAGTPHLPVAEEVAVAAQDCSAIGLRVCCKRVIIVVAVRVQDADAFFPAAKACGALLRTSEAMLRRSGVCTAAARHCACKRPGILKAKNLHESQVLGSQGDSRNVSWRVCMSALKVASCS